MRTYNLLIGLILFWTTPLWAQGWLPGQTTVSPQYRLL